MSGSVRQCTLADIIRWRDFGGGPQWVQPTIDHEEYLVIKNTIRHKPVEILDDIPSQIKVELNRYSDISNLVLTGSWFLGTQFDETDDKRWLDHRELINKPRFSDIDLWLTSYSEEKWRHVKSRQGSIKVDLLRGWWGNGINLDTGEIVKCQSK